MRPSFCLAPLLLFCSGAILQAQQTGISGRVTDAGGGTLANASIEVKQAGGSAYRTKSNSDGSFLVPSLTAGDYTVTVSAEGFSTVETSVSMLVGQTPEVNTILPVASVNSSVIVRERCAGG